jgi:phosphoribosylformylglycinamidine synthase II
VWLYEPHPFVCKKTPKPLFVITQKLDYYAYMISRIYVRSLVADSRGEILAQTFNHLGLRGSVAQVSVIDCYTIDAKLSAKELSECASLLANPVIEVASINEMPPVGPFTFGVEIGFLPGVTDNTSRTVAEEITDKLKRVFKDGEGVYTSRLFCITGTISVSDAEKIAFSLHNPLIERAYIAKASVIKKENGLPRVVPHVVLEKKKPVINVSLSVSDEELSLIGKQGILDPNGTRRGPLALDLESMKIIQTFFKKLKRKPTDIELESLAQTWSEHCKHTIFANSIDDIKEGLYKSYIKAATNRIRKEKGKNDFCVSVFSDNAGGIVFDKDFMITHKVETHNSPSALDPFGGAITGIVGVNRDTIGFGLGAKPVANTYGFCFGYPDDVRPLFRDKAQKQKMLPPRRIIDGVIKGVNVGGNCSGIPTVSGFVKYDDRFRGKPLVFVGTVGLLPMKINGKPSHEKEAQKGDYIVIIGGRVGADGIHGATFSSVAMDSSSPATAVQIGDPITQKKLSDAIVKEARDKELYTSITDNGAGGISCSIAEMAKECGGCIVDIETVPTKYPGLSPWQIWISESQERMTLSVPKSKWNEFEALMESRGVLAVRVGVFTDSGSCVVRHNGTTIMDMPMEFLHNGLPIRQLVSEKKEVAHAEPKLPQSSSRTKELLSLLKEGNIGGFDFISQQYDHEVQATSVIKPLSGRGRINTDAQVFRPVLTSHKGVVVTAALYPSYSDISTYDMAACAIDTAIRNAIATGGTLSHLAVLDNFCWCSSYDKGRLSELVDAVKALYDYTVGYGTPIISGKDSMFNDFRGYDEKGNPIAISIPPTLLISAIGVVKDIRKVVTPEFKIAGDMIYLLGETHDELGASEYYKLLAKGDMPKIGNSVPKVDLPKNIKIYKVLESAIDKELVASSVSVASGGLAVALAKASVGGNLGLNIDLKNILGSRTSLDAKLFSESQGRILVSVAKSNIVAFEKMMKGIPCTKLGTVTKGTNVSIKDGKNSVVDTTVEALAKSYSSFSKQF